jgi:hypothetical protein
MIMGQTALWILSQRYAVIPVLLAERRVMEDPEVAEIWHLCARVLRFQFEYVQLRKQPDKNRLKSKSKSNLCYDRRLFGQSHLVSSTHLGLKISFLLLSDSYGFVSVRQRTGLSFEIADGLSQRNNFRVRTIPFIRDTLDSHETVHS